MTSRYTKLSWRIGRIPFKKKKRSQEQEKEEEKEEDKEGEKRRKRKKTVLTFARREGRPSDSIRYMKGRRTPSARIREVMSRRITGRWRKEENAPGTYGRQREDESGSGLTIGMFSDSNIQRERKRERKREGDEKQKERRKETKKKKDREKGKNRARIYRVTLSGLFQRRPKAELVLSSSFQSRPFIKSSRGRAYIFPRIHSQDFLPSSLPFFFFILLFLCHVALLRKIWRFLGSG